MENCDAIAYSLISLSCRFSFISARLYMGLTHVLWLRMPHSHTLLYSHSPPSPSTT